MRFLQIITLFLLIAVFSVHSAKWRALPNVEKLKGKTGQCFESEYNMGYMTSGEVRNANGSCVRVQCEKDGGIEYDGCGIVDGCSKAGDNSKPYPKCCPCMS